MDNMVKMLRQEVRKYASKGLGSVTYPLLDDEHLTYGVISIDDPRRQTRQAELVVVMARIEDDYIIVEVDNTDKQLVDALIQQGIPREKIVLAYAGETRPETAPVAGD